LVNSYQPQNAYRHDMSVYQTFNLVWWLFVACLG
jgi:hypothetical protein